MTSLILLQVILADIILSGDNAIVIAMAAEHLPNRKQVIAFGMLLAAALRIILTFFASNLFDNKFASLVGATFLFYVAWSLYEDIKEDEAEAEGKTPRPIKFWQALVVIVIADCSMSLDNIVAVAAMTVGHPYILAFGLLLSIGLLGVAAEYISRLLQKYPVLSYFGVVFILFIACRMVFLNPLVHQYVGI